MLMVNFMHKLVCLGPFANVFIKHEGKVYGVGEIEEDKFDKGVYHITTKEVHPEDLMD